MTSQGMRTKQNNQMLSLTCSIVYSICEEIKYQEDISGPLPCECKTRTRKVISVMVRIYLLVVFSSDIEGRMVVQVPSKDVDAPH